jgi:hypothetical protein
MIISNSSGYYEMCRATIITTTNLLKIQPNCRSVGSTGMTDEIFVNGEVVPVLN